MSPNKANANEVIEAMKWRYATKVFDPSKKISAPDWQALEESLILSPSSYGLQPWKFLLIQDPAVRQQLRTVSWNQSQVTDCSHYVVFAGREDVSVKDVERWIECIQKVQHRDEKSITMYREMMMGDLVNGPRHSVIGEWISRQVYIALGTFMTAAAMLRVDACPMEGLDPAKYDEILKLNGTGYKTKVACAAGYRAATDKYASLPKARYTKDALIQTV